MAVDPFSRRNFLIYSHVLALYISTEKTCIAGGAISLSPYSKDSRQTGVKYCLRLDLNIEPRTFSDRKRCYFSYTCFREDQYACAFTPKSAA